MVELSEIFEEWNSYAEKKILKSREINLSKIITTSKTKIITVTGVRRSGKTSILLLIYQKIKNSGEKCAYINLEDNRIKDHPEILDEIIKWSGDEGTLMLDEITSVKGWEGWLARNHELLKGKLKIIISSSRHTLMKPTKSLRGRILPLELYPLSFKEFLKFNNINIEKTTAGAGIVEKNLKEFLTNGGFPEISLIKGKTEKVELLNTYFRDIIGLDVAEITKESVSVVELFGKYVLNTSYFSASKCLNFYKSAGYKISKQSILEIEKHSQGSYLFFFIPIASRNIKDKNQYPRKAYPIDTGFMNSITGKSDYGKLYENVVFIELKRRILLNDEITYWKNKEGKEVDFVITRGIKTKEIIQVVYEIKEQNTKDREVKGLIGCAKEYGIKTGLIITKNYEGKEIIDGIKIRYLPLSKWLLSLK